MDHIISDQGILMDPTKVEAMLNWEAPKSVMEIRSFLGLAGYYRRFIEGFSRIAAPLTKLTRKDENFEWSDQCKQSFQQLKKRLTEAPVLVLPQENAEFVVYTNASKNDLGCVLMQNNGVIAYASR